MTNLTGFQVGEFRLVIPQGDHLASGHIRLVHGTQYEIELINSAEWPCDADVCVDGKYIGSWRIDARSRIVLERPVNDSGRFTFYQIGSDEAKSAGLIESNDLGLISVTFKPGRERVPEVLRRPARGGTGLSGYSLQRFQGVEALEYFDGGKITIHARLFCDNPQVRPLRGCDFGAVPAPLPTGAGTIF